MLEEYGLKVGDKLQLQYKKKPSKNPHPIVIIEKFAHYEGLDYAHFEGGSGIYLKLQLRAYNNLI